MLYKFKSKAAGDVIMLQANGEQILRIIGKEPGPKGIVLPEQMPAAIAALEKATAQGQAAQPPADAGAPDDKDDTPAADRVSLRQRATPFIDMLRRCHQADKEIVWGV
ncbi:DUF1840 domain-containing protein [Comamonadaceae bacterium G21597-S1]|nr:DUF1840 domain-containing protein [Comamonadaceae bacterium G21597-S1]